MGHIERIRNLIIEKKQKIKKQNQKITPIKEQIKIKENEVYNLKLDIIEADNLVKILEEEIEQLQIARNVLEKIETVGSE